jgi:hypothetical protein
MCMVLRPWLAGTTSVIKSLRLDQVPNPSSHFPPYLIPPIQITRAKIASTWPRANPQAQEAASPGESAGKKRAMTADEGEDIMMYFRLRTRVIQLQQRLLQEEREKDQRTRNWIAGQTNGLS